MLLALKEDKPLLSQSPTEKVEGVKIWRSRDPESGTSLDQTIAQRTANFRMLSRYYGCVLALCHVQKQHLVCLQVGGAALKCRRR